MDPKDPWSGPPWPILDHIGPYAAGVRPACGPRAADVRLDATSGMLGATPLGLHALTSLRRIYIQPSVIPYSPSAAWHPLQEAFP